MIIKHKLIHIIILLIILFLAFLLRIYKLNSKPLWYDETVSISHMEQPIKAFLFSSRINYKPVYFILLKIWSSVFRDNSSNLRFLSLICGVLSVYFIYLLASFMFNKEIGLTSAFILSISVFHIFQCQQVRQFSFIVLLSIASMLCFLKFVQFSKKSYLFGNMTLNIMLIFTHPYGFCIIIIELISAILFLRGRSFSQWLYSQLILALFIALWLYLPNKNHLKELIWWIKKPNLVLIMEVFNTFSWGGPRYGLDDFMIPKSWLFLPSLLSFYYVFLFLIGIKAGAKKNNKNKILLLSLWLILPILFSFILSQLGSLSIFSIKHLIISLPAFYIIVAAGVSSLGKKLKIFVIGTIFILNIAPLKIMYNNFFSVDWKTSTEYIKKSVKAKDIIVVSLLSEIVPFMYYFDGSKQSLRDIDIYGKIIRNQGFCSYNTVFTIRENILLVGIKQNNFEYQSLSDIQDFKNKIESKLFIKNKCIWSMLSRQTSPELKRYIHDYLDNNFERADFKEFNGVEVSYFVPKQILVRPLENEN